MDRSQRLELPFILPGQSQKELFHNEALQLLDTIVAAAVEEGPRDSPPAAPIAGSSFIVGPGPTGAWAGEAGRIASYSAAGWRFIAPVEGLQAWVKSTSTWAQYRAGEWEAGTVRGSRLVLDGVQVVAGRSPAIADPSGGSTIDAQARSAVLSILSALRHHGLIETE